MTPTIYDRAEEIIQECFNRLKQLGFSQEEIQMIKNRIVEVIKEIRKERRMDRMREEEFS